jgi:hypothetical protein
MSRSVTPRGSGSPAPRSGGQLVGRGPTNLGYETAEAVGFELVPERVRQYLLSSAVIGTEPLSANPRTTERHLAIVSGALNQLR